MPPSAATLVVPLLLALAVGASVQQPEFPPDAKAKVLDLTFKVEDFGSKTADLAVKETDFEVRIELAADVLFDFDRDTLQPQANDTLTKAASFIRDREVKTARIEGHTDSKGDDAYNQKLSQRRADAVRRWFVEHGLGALRFSVVGFGETRPVAPNAAPNGADDPAGRQKNRRVEIVLSKGR